jgi:hypothetical protein
VKKVQITPNKKRLSAWTLSVFPSAESAYFWSIPKKTSDEKQHDAEIVKLANDEFIEAEWCGCQFAYEEDNAHVRLDLVRFAKAHKSKNGAGLLVDTYAGWITGGSIPFRDYKDNDVTVTKIESDGKLDLPSLFGDEILEKESDNKRI